MNQVPNDTSPWEVLPRLMAGKIAVLREEGSRGQQTRAMLRKSIGKKVEESPKTWNFLYANTPDEVTTRKDYKKMERALFAALQLYAVHAKKIDTPHSDEKEATVGRTLESIARNSSSPENFTKKITGLFSEDDFNAITRKLLTYIRQSGLPLNYFNLVCQLYLLQTDRRQDVLYRWGRDFYRTSNKNSSTNPKDEK